MRTATCLVLLLVSAAASAEINCSRSQLRTMVNTYIETQTAGDPDLMPLLEHGQMRWVHTLTVCDPEPMCGGRPGN